MPFMKGLLCQIVDETNGCNSELHRRIEDMGQRVIDATLKGDGVLADLTALDYIKEYIDMGKAVEKLVEVIRELGIDDEVVAALQKPERKGIASEKWRAWQQGIYSEVRRSANSGGEIVVERMPDYDVAEKVALLPDLVAVCKKHILVVNTKQEIQAVLIKMGELEES